MNRREFGRSLVTAVAGTTAMPAWLRMASAQAVRTRHTGRAPANTQNLASGYKALVCIALSGGCDGNNVIVPLDNASYNNYATTRKNLALSKAALLPVVDASGRAWGLHPALRNTASMYSTGNAAVVMNVGPLAQPATKAQIQSGAMTLPDSLLSHTAGSAEWETASTSLFEKTGWGGRISDTIAAQNALPLVLSAAGTSKFATGVQGSGACLPGSDPFGPPLPTSVFEQVMSIASREQQNTNVLVQNVANMQITTVETTKIMLAAEAASPSLKPVFPDTDLGSQLNRVALQIGGRSVSGLPLQIFYCRHHNYDTHIGQINFQQALLSDLDQSVAAFFEALEQLGVAEHVVVMTVSDFGRTYSPNGNAGSDHAWANNLIVYGGGIAGGQNYGTAPDWDLGGSCDLGSQGVWIPTTSVAQYAAGAASWLGVSDSQLSAIFPTLSNFTPGPLRIF